MSYISTEKEEEEEEKIREWYWDLEGELHYCGVLTSKADDKGIS